MTTGESPADLKVAVQAVRKAAEQGDAEAQFQMAVCLNYGIGLPKDPALAASWCLKAAAQGHCDAMISMVSREREPAERRKWLLQCEGRSVMAETMLGTERLLGLNSSTVDVNAGLQHLRKAAALAAAGKVEFRAASNHFLPMFDTRTLTEASSVSGSGVGGCATIRELKTGGLVVVKVMQRLFLALRSNVCMCRNSMWRRWRRVCSSSSR